jgi:hypothetical protein
MPRVYESVKCPVCGQFVMAYPQTRLEGSALRIVYHQRQDARGPVSCEGSGQTIPAGET